MKKFLIWLKDNHWHVYKDGTWYTLNDKPYTQEKQRRFYTESEVVEIYEECYYWQEVKQEMEKLCH